MKKNEELKEKLQNPLLALRYSVALVLTLWTLDKFINPTHASKVYESFYFLSIPSSVMLFIWIAELILIVLFLIGRYKKTTYLLVFIIHWVSTLSAVAKYFSPFEGSNLLFFAAWPMLAACYALYALREEDTKFNF